MQKNEQLRLANTNKGIAIKKAVYERYNFYHPVNQQINKVDLIEFSLKLRENHYRNAVFFGRGQLDRSPFGTGTCVNE